MEQLSAESFSIGISNHKKKIQFLFQSEYIPSQLSKEVDKCLKKCKEDLKEIGAENVNYDFFLFSSIEFRGEILKEIIEKGTNRFIEDLLAFSLSSEDLTGPNIKYDSRLKFV
ncbi:hypothetical protein FAI40_07455 [Acetobacteraceae bacterium]|nr:hypothetical protein FAI40_07455 [Acetobacteraceae bacterium]